jgi:PA14 domain
MRRWILLSLLSLIFILSAIVPPVSTSAAPQSAIATVTRDSIVGRAWLLAMGQWVSPKTVYANQYASPPRWGTFYAGRTYTGMAYSQNNPQENWEAFKWNMDHGIGVPGVDQGTDCSGFASFAWQIPRQTTGTFLPSGYVYQLNSLSSLLPGDGLLRPYDHIGIYYDRLDNGNFVILEQTNPHALRNEWTYSYAATYKPVRRYAIGTPSTPTPTPTPVPPPPQSVVAGRFYGEYFANTTLSGSPVRTENIVYPLNKSWGTASPGSGVPSDGFSARWSGSFYFAAGTYTFNVASADGVRVWLDGKLIEDHWTQHTVYSYRDEHSLTTGFHTVKVEYFHRSGDALVTLRWWKTRTCPSGQFLGEFFSNTYLGGAPDTRTCEAPINYNWGGDGPAVAMPDDNFSARWEGSFTFQARPYTFIARPDDGMLVWVDNVLIIDQWHDQAPTEYRVTRTMTAGTHTVLVRYYEHLGGAVAQFRWE